MAGAALLTGTAQAGTDFEPVAPHVEHMAAGQGRIDLRVPVVADPARPHTWNFYVVID